MAEKDLVAESRRRFLKAYKKLLALKPFFQENADKWFVLEKPAGVMQGSQILKIIPAYLEQYETQVQQILSPGNREREILGFMNDGTPREMAEQFCPEPPEEVADFTSMHIQDVEHLLHARKATSKQAAELQALQTRLENLKIIATAGIPGIEKHEVKKRIKHIEERIKRIREDLKRSH
jgi:hypothetical protein